jgi:hypothetical protein
MFSLMVSPALNERSSLGPESIAGFDAISFSFLTNLQSKRGARKQRAGIRWAERRGNQDA